MTQVPIESVPASAPGNGHNMSISFTRFPTWTPQEEQHVSQDPERGYGGGSRAGYGGAVGGSEGDGLQGGGWEEVVYGSGMRVFMDDHPPPGRTKVSHLVSAHTHRGPRCFPSVTGCSRKSDSGTHSHTTLPHVPLLRHCRAKRMPRRTTTAVGPPPPSLLRPRSPAPPLRSDGPIVLAVPGPPPLRGR